MRLGTHDFCDRQKQLSDLRSHLVVVHPICFIQATCLIKVSAMLHVAREVDMKIIRGAGCSRGTQARHTCYDIFTSVSTYDVGTRLAFICQLCSS
jgi:hypothetical protein